MTSFLSLPLELRQNILSHAIAAADGEDALSLLQFSRLFVPRSSYSSIYHYGHLYRIYQYGQIPLNGTRNAENKDRILPLHYMPTVAELLDNLVAVHGSPKADLVNVVNKWADEKKSQVNSEYFYRNGENETSLGLPPLWSAWVFGLQYYTKGDVDDRARWRKLYKAAMRVLQEQRWPKSFPVKEYGFDE